MERALQAQNRTILYSLCNWGVDQVWTWGNETGNSWRMSNDIGFGEGECISRSYPTTTSLANICPVDWNRVLEILNVNSFLLNWTNFWGRNDPDMLEVGPSTSP